MRRILLFAGLLVSFLTSVPSTFGQSYTVDATTLYVRLNPRGFVIGTLFRDEGFHRRQTVGDYSFGYAAGSFQGSGWVETARLKPGGNTPARGPATGFTGSGEDSRAELLRCCARNINDYVRNARTQLPLIDGGSPVQIKAGAKAGLYGNYRGGRFLNRYPGITLTQESKIAWRYVTKDGRAVLVNLNYGDEANAVWGFIPREDLPDKLPYSDDRAR